MAAAIKMDELLVSWLSSDEVYESVLGWIENYSRASTPENTNRFSDNNSVGEPQATSGRGRVESSASLATLDAESTTATDESPTGVIVKSVVIPPFYPKKLLNKDQQDDHGHLLEDDDDLSKDDPVPPRRRWRRTPVRQYNSWEPQPEEEGSLIVVKNNTAETSMSEADPSHQNVAGNLVVDTTPSALSKSTLCARDQAQVIFSEIGQDPPITSPSSVDSDEMDENDRENERFFLSSASSLQRKYLTPDSFVRITKEVCQFPSFFNLPLYQRILDEWNAHSALEDQRPMEVITFEMLEWYWKQEMEPYDLSDRFFRLVKQPDRDYIGRDDFLPFIKALLSDHPGLEFLSTHAEFQEKYALTVITRIFYSVNRCHSGRITSRQIRLSDLYEACLQVDEEEDINKVTRYFSYEHFYVLYCRFWELDNDRDYRITREDLLKYGDHSLSHMIVDRIFDAAPRPFGEERPNRECMSYEDFIYFMLSEEDKSNEVSVRYWFTCVDVDGDGKLNNMELRSFYAVQLHRMQCMGHEIVPFEDMLCQMMDMIKPARTEYLVVEDFLQSECSAVSGALFDALFNLNKYLMFEQRDPFVERQKREDEFECDWDRFACVDYNRLAMEEEAREEEAMEIDWVTVDDEEHAEAQASKRHQESGPGANEAPF